jgi:hypothetical protein
LTLSFIPFPDTGHDLLPRSRIGGVLRGDPVSADRLGCFTDDMYRSVRVVDPAAQDAGTRAAVLLRREEL